jgi:excisionase family DNA binding protein
MPDEEKRMLTTQNVADMAGVSRQTVWRAARTHDLPARRHGRDYLITEEDAIRWADAYQPYAALRKPKDGQPGTSPETPSPAEGDPSRDPCS